ncbi:hypothetical protein ACFL58_04715 [Elusimicrobiota bacterium]
MNKVEILDKKVHEVAKELIFLKQERKKLLSDIKFMEEENKKSGDLIRENGSLRELKKTAGARIEKILKKLNALNV